MSVVIIGMLWHQKKDIRPIYQELQGYLSQDPPISEAHQDVTYDRTLWDQANTAIDLLAEITGSDAYERFKIVPAGTGRHSHVMMATFRTKLGGLVDRLHAEFFDDEDRPFGGSPTQIITQQQTQDQTTDVRVIMVLEIQERIVERLQDPDTPSEEKEFLERLKPGLATVRTAVELVQLILNTAKLVGIDLATLMHIFN